MSNYDPAFPGMLNCEGTRFTDVDTLSTEQFLFDSYWKELINLYGVGINYQVHRYDKTIADNLYGEHSNQEYADPIQMVALVELQENALSLSKYGFVTDDQITLYFHIQTYIDTFEPLGIYQEVNQKHIAPKAGDIFEMYEFGKTRPLGMSGKKFIVTERTDQDVGININQLAGHYVWVVKAKRYDPSYEPNVGEESESYQIFDDEYTGRIEENVEVRRNPSEQKQYDYNIQQETNEHVFNYEQHMVDTSVYGGYLKLFNINTVHKMSWYATSRATSEYELQPTTLTEDRYFECDLATEYNSNKQSIQLPSIYTVTKVEIYNKVNGEWQVIGDNDAYSVSLFDVNTITKDIDGEPYSYKQYTYNGVTVGDRRARFYIVPTFGVIREDTDITTLPWYATINHGEGFSKIDTPLVSSGDETYYHTFLTGDTNNIKQSIKIPSDWELYRVQIYDKINGVWATLGGLDEISITMFEATEELLQINGELFNYTTYTYTGPMVGEREMKFYVKYKDMKFYTAPVSGLVIDSDAFLNDVWYATTKDTSTYTEQNGIKQKDDTYYYEVMLAGENSDSPYRQSIRIPNNYMISYIEVWNPLINAYSVMYGRKDYSVTTFVKEKCEIAGYDQYTNTGPRVGERNMRFYITIADASPDVSTETVDVDDLPWYATSNHISVFTKQSADQFVPGEYFECNLRPETNTAKQSIQIPATYDIKYVKLYNPYSNRWMFIGNKEQSVNDFTVTHINKPVGDKVYSYKQYTHNGEKTGERILRFYI